MNAEPSNPQAAQTPGLSEPLCPQFAEVMQGRAPRWLRHGGLLALAGILCALVALLSMNTQLSLPVRVIGIVDVMHGESASGMTRVFLQVGRKEGVSAPSALHGPLQLLASSGIAADVHPISAVQAANAAPLDAPMELELDTSEAIRLDLRHGRNVADVSSYRIAWYQHPRLARLAKGLLQPWSMRSAARAETPNE